MDGAQFQVVIDPELGREVAGVVAFGDFKLKDDAESGVVYPSSGLEGFYNDLLLGRPFPLVLASRGIHTVGQLLIVALFLHRDLALHPRTMSLVAAVDLVDRLRIIGLAHIEPDLRRFFKLLTGFLPPKLGRKKQQKRLTTAVEWLRDYIVEDRLPALSPELPSPKILDTGTGGFVVAETQGRGDLDEGWVDLFRQGFLWGLLCTPAQDGRRRALGGRKSGWVPLGLGQIASNLNAAESAMQEPPEWVVDECWLQGPEAGTLLPIEAIVKVLIHV